MSIRDFLSAVLPEQGCYCIMTIAKSGDRTFPKNVPFGDLTAAAQYAQCMAQSADVYFALSSFAYPTERFTRKASNALRQRSFWLDLDCDPEKAASGEAYATKADAVKALGDFLKRTGLPMPTAVDSGHGFHLYWALSHSIPTAQWKELAFKLRTICQHYGLIADHHRTCDAASVLRVPGTFNLKETSALPVVLKFTQKTFIDPVQFAKTLLSLASQLADAQPCPATTPDGVSVPPLGMPIPSGLSFSGDFASAKDLPPRGWKQMVLKCRQIREMASSSYPAWMLAVRTVLHTTGGPEMVHALSKLDPSKYNPVTTDKTIKSLQENTDYGAGLCDTFASHCLSKCQDCPYRGKVKSPIALAEIAVPETVTMPAVAVDKMDLSGGDIALGDADRTIEVKPYDDGRFAVVPKQGIFFRTESADGTPMSVKISDIELYIHTLCIDNTQGRVPLRTYIMRKIAPGCAPVDIPFAIEDAYGPQKTETWCAQCGIAPAPRNKKPFIEFMNTYISAVQNTLPEVYVRNHFGWEQWTDKTTGKTYPGFIVGNEMYTAQGTKGVRLDERSQSVASKLGVKGSLDEWKKVPAIYKTLDQKFAQLLMCTAFGAPLMQCGKGTATNVAYNFWDVNGGKGKSSMLKAIASVWGDPSQMLMGRTDTHAARFQQYAVYRNLPILIDELTGINDADTAALLYDIVNGREKARSTTSGTGLAQSGHWDTISIFTANQSMYESLRDFKAQTSATCMRLIEAVCDFKDYTSTPYAVAINDAMTAARNNFGLAGKVFIEFIMKHPNATNIVSDYAEKFATQYAKTSDERFWMYGIAIPLCAGRIAKALGLLDYDMDALEQYCINELLPSLRAKVKQDKPTGGNLLMDFLNDNLANTLIVQAHTRTEFDCMVKSCTIEKSNFADVLDPYIIQLPTQHLFIRRELVGSRVYVSTKALNAWCKQNGISLDSLLNDLRPTGQMPFGSEPRRERLASGVDHLPAGLQTAYVFKLRDGDKLNEQP